MPRGTKIKMNELADRLTTLDIDEGIRIEYVNSKLFINKNASGIYVVQFDDEDNFRYFDSPNKVSNFIKSKIPMKGSAWTY
jgi:hypothetical protein